jgi:2-C-methyl-D-erythritol 4-phosphate cytidylyltransferase
MSVWAIVAAAGRGDRLGADRPKAFVALGGRVLLAESIDRLEDCDAVDAIVVAAPPGWEEPAILLAEELGAGKVVSVVSGGATRGASVAAALAEVGDDATAVLVHDAARPLVTNAVVARLLAALEDGWDGAIPGLAVTDTVKRVEGERVVETLARDALVAVQTPQAFRAEALRAAYASGAEATDCAARVEATGGRVRVVEGDEQLAKITTAEDLARVEAWLR